ncbi:MAG: efflux RND transporter periplasmic adaptor subunit [Polyangiales bacterium]
MNTRWISISAVVTAFAAGALLGRALPDEVVNTRAEASARPEAVAAARRVRMSATLRERAGITSAPARRSALSQRVALTGGVEFDGDHLAEVGSRIAGRVARVLVRPGDEVRAGDPLLEIESAALGEASAQLLSARAAATASRAERARLESLAARQLATARELDQARAACATNDAMVQAATQRLLALGVSAGEIAGRRGSRLQRVTVRAPIAGRVVERHAVLGQVVEPATSLLRLADPTRLWVQLRVFEGELSKVRVGDAVTLQATSHPELTLEGTVGHIAAELDRETRTARVRVEVTDRQGVLRPGQFVEARLLPSAGRAVEALRIPRDATVQVEGRDAVFVDLGDGVYELRTLQLGAPDGDQVEVLRGVSEGERVVTRGGFALKSELLR